MLEDGSRKLKNSEAGMTVVVKAKVIKQSCFAMELRESARHSSGKKSYSRGEIKRISANEPQCQFAGGRWVVRWNNWTEHNRYVLLL